MKREQQRSSSQMNSEEFKGSTTISCMLRYKKEDSLNKMTRIEKACLMEKLLGAEDWILKEQ
jgi:hypothetical protein